MIDSALALIRKFNFLNLLDILLLDWNNLEFKSCNFIIEYFVSENQLLHHYPMQRQIDDFLNAVTL